MQKKKEKKEALTSFRDHNYTLYTVFFLDYFKGVSFIKRRMEESERKSHMCYTCYLVFESEEFLASHREKCVDKKPHVCWKCHANFNTESKLTEHKLRQHNQEDNIQENTGQILKF